MALANSTFNSLELFNVKLDVWIDEEDYDKIYDCVKINESASEVDKLFRHGPDKPSILKIKFQDLLKIKAPIKRLRTLQKLPVTKLDSQQKPLIWAKYLRAKIMDRGTDDYTKLLDDLVVYLQKNLPYQSPAENNKIILQHLYFQELSACATPGLESLGFAFRAEAIIKECKNKNYSKLYELWSKLNQGIGYFHSRQMEKAARSLDDVIREFELSSRTLRTKLILSLWRKLIFEKAILMKAELQQELQLSYHVIQTLKSLGDSKRSNSVLLRAQAYLEMGSLEKVKNEFKRIWGLPKFPPTASEAFKECDLWGKQLSSKKSIVSLCVGILHDYYLQAFNDKTQGAPTTNDVKQFTKRLMCFFNSYPLSKKIKSERTSFYHQLARHLEWLSGHSYLALADRLYKNFRDELPHIKKHLEQLKQFGEYEYDRYTEAMANFYKNISVESRYTRYKSYEGNFLKTITDYERENRFLFQFKRSESDHRNYILGWNKQRKLSECKLCLKGANHPGPIRSLLSGCKPRRPSKNLLTCITENALTTGDYEGIIKTQRTNFSKFIEGKSLHESNRRSLNFIGLQRWNSATPALSLSRGGGYFLYETSDSGEVVLGIAIDPGFNFLENLFNMGFTLSDIDFVLLSHGHADHIRDFEPIVDLLDFMRKNREKSDKPHHKANHSPKRIHLILSQGVYKKFEHIISDTNYREYLSDTYIIDIDKGIDNRIIDGKHGALPPFKFLKGKQKNLCTYFPILDDSNSPDFTIQPTWAYHNDRTKISDSFGFIIKFRFNGKYSFSFGYTGDTKWEPDAHKQYKDCDTILIHLGSLIKIYTSFNEYNDSKKCRELIAEKDHPYVFGLLHYMTQLAKIRSKPTLILLSEFGEELKGRIRIDFTDRLKKSYNKNLDFLPVDVGLNVQLTAIRNGNDINKVLCSLCKRFVEPKEIRPQQYGHGYDEALFYFCSTCDKSTPPNIIQEKMRNISEYGVKLQKSIQ